MPVGLFFILKSVILVTQSVPKKSQAKRIGYSLDNREVGENPARSRHCKQEAHSRVLGQKVPFDQKEQPLGNWEGSCVL